MGDQTRLTEHTLDKKRYKDGVKLNGTFVTTVTDEAAFLPTGALNLEELQAIYHTIIYFLRKIIAYIKDNCYHNIGSGTKGHGSWVLERQDGFGSWFCLFVGFSFFHEKLFLKT